MALPEAGQPTLDSDGTEALALYRVQSPIQMILYSESDASDNA